MSRRTGVPMGERIDEVDFTRATREPYGRYARHILGYRHFASGRDGLLPSQRRALWTLRQLGATSRSSSTKTAKAAGYTCFVAGTPVATPDGPVAIEHLEVGDLVLTSRGVRSVVTTFHNEPKTTMVLTMADGRVVVPTVGQEFKVKMGDLFFWKTVEELSPGDEIVAL